MALYEISTPVAEPVSLEEAKNHLRLSADFSDDDELIKAIITGARIEAESRTGGRVFSSRTWEWTPDETLRAGTTYEVPVSPAMSITVKNKDDETVPSSNYTFVKSSLAPYGNPLYGKLTPEVDIEGAVVTVTAGWPNETKTRKVVSTVSPTFKPEYTTFTENSITLQFDTKVNGEVSEKSFTVMVEDMYMDVYSVTVDGGRVTLHFSDELMEDTVITLSYVSGFLHDEDDNFVMPIMREKLPAVDFSKTATAIPAAQNETVTLSTVPAVVKSWMLVRIATLYQQRSEIAIQAGKTSNSFFPRDFIGGLLDAYTVEKA